MDDTLFISSRTLGQQKREETRQFDQGEGVPLEHLKPIVLVHRQEAAAGDLAEKIGKGGAFEAENGGEVAC